ncbi:MAG: purine-nucleoside phosphorylase [Rikenellaceae bacterium]
MYTKTKEIAKRLNSELFESRGLQAPKVAVVLGSGLGDFVNHIDNSQGVEYSSIEGFVKSTVAGHRGRFVGGTIEGVSVVAMEGRVHYYEGYSMNEVVMGMRIMCQMGIEVVVMTNAAGGINETFNVGDIMLIRDHINLLPNPLIGANDERFGVRFPDMTEPYSKRLRAIAEECAEAAGVSLQCGVYVASSGPTYETPAEYEYFHRIGADACGMSTTGEVIAARHIGVEVLGFSVITNIGRGPNANKFNSHAEVVEASNGAALKLQEIVKRSIAVIGK